MDLKKRSLEKKKLKFACFVLAPVKVLLCGARDFTINTFCACAGMIGEGSAMMTGFAILPQVYPMPGNCSSSSSSSSSTKEKKNIESSRELTRVITTTNAEGDISQISAGGQGGKLNGAAESGGYQRSYSTGVGQIGRIDEDVPCDFLEPKCK